MVTTLHPNPADDVFVSEVEEDSLLESAFPGIDTENLAEEERFLDIIAYVCQKMKVPHFYVGQVLGRCPDPFHDGFKRFQPDTNPIL